MHPTGDTPTNVGHHPNRIPVKRNASFLVELRASAAELSL